MQYFSHLPNASYAPTYEVEDDEGLVFCGTITRTDELPEDVYWVPLEDTLVVVRRDHDRAPAFPVALVRQIAEADESGRSLWSGAWDVFRHCEDRTVTRSPNLRNVQVTAHGGGVADDGETGFRLIFVSHDDVPKDILDNFVRERYPHTFCQHEHDCCGHAYKSWPQLQQRDEYMAIYRQGWHLNI